MSNYDKYLFQSPMLEEGSYPEATTLYYNEEYDCFVDDYGNIYTLQEDRSGYYNESSSGLSAFNEKARLNKKRKKIYEDDDDENEDEDKKRKRNDSIAAYVGNHVGGIVSGLKHNYGRLGAQIGGAAVGTVAGPLGPWLGAHAGNMIYNKMTGRPIGQMTNSRIDEYGQHRAVKESYGLSAFDETDEYSSQSLGTGLGKAFDTGNKLWNININNFDQTFDSDFIGPGDEYCNKTNLPALRAAAITGGKPHPGTISNGINGKSSSKPFRLKELRDDFGQNG